MNYEDEAWDFYKKVKRVFNKYPEVKNYKELCKVLKEKPKSGDSKTSQLKYWNNFFSYKRSGHSYKNICVKTPEEVTEYLQNRIADDINRFKRFFPHIENLDSFDWEIFSSKKGVYKIYKDNSIYIGSTVVNFHERFKQHLAPSNTLTTNGLFEKNYKFDILWVANDDDTTKFIRKKEDEYIQLYKQQGYSLINSNNAYKIYIPPSLYTIIRVRKEDIDKIIILMQNNNIKFKCAKGVKNG